MLWPAGAYMRWPEAPSDTLLGPTGPEKSRQNATSQNAKFGLSIPTRQGSGAGACGRNLSVNRGHIFAQPLGVYAYPPSQGGGNGTGNAQLSGNFLAPVPNAQAASTIQHPGYSERRHP